ncbi:MAG TPA: hypothetical protein VK581_15395 [Chthoniobacterales bacterium]|nr:hypothetical protein [Chthoniobacterales bacterium]
MKVAHLLFRFVPPITLLLVTAHCLYAPISEVESPTPAPEQSTKPKVKRKSKPAVSESSTASVKQVAPSPSQSNRTAQKPSIFEGTWVGNLLVPITGNTTFTFVMNADGTLEKETSVFGSMVRPCTSNGKSMTWTFELGGVNTFTPSPDGKTAWLVGHSALGHWSGVFRKISR